MNSFNTTEHFDLLKSLSKLAKLGKISEQEKENLLTKSGLSKVDDKQYKDESGAILIISH